MENEDSDRGQDNPVKELFLAPLYISSSESRDSMVGISDLLGTEPEISPKMKLYMEGLYSPGSGEICAKYIAASDSTVVRHAYYNYPAIIDPGIEEALLYPEPVKKYDDDGQELYLDLCKKMNLIPIRIFHRALLTEEINLKYYGVNPVSVRAMCMALERNQNVTRLDLTSNFLDHDDATYHIGEMLGYKNALTELVLSGCNIGSRYLRRALRCLSTRVMDLLDLSGNKIKDEGFPALTEQIFQGAVIKRLNLKRNDLTSDSLVLLAEVLDFHDHTTHLDLSWNKFYTNQGAIQLVRTLRHSKVLVELNMSYCSLTLGVDVGALLRIQTLEVLDLSNNRLTPRAAKIVAKNLILAKSLRILDLSSNPFSPSDALEILLSMKIEEIKLKELRMDFISVNKDFAYELNEIRNLEFRKNTVITHGHILRNYTLLPQDIKVIYLKQLVTLTTQKHKKGHADAFDILVWILDESKTQQVLEIPVFQRIMKKAGAPVEDDFLMGMSRCFPGPKTEAKIRPLNLEMMVDYIHRIYPDKEPTPTPVGTPPEPIPEKKKKGGKKKK